MSDAVVAFFDGLCKPAFPGGPGNPGGLGCGGWYIQPHPALQDGLRGRACYGSDPSMSNNVAEFLAALDCLRAIYKAGYRGPVALHGDSQLVVKLVNGEWECQAPHLQPLLERLHLAAQHFASVTMTWVPRTSNTEADEESRAAYKEATR